MIEDAIYTKLTGDPGVSGLVGTRVRALRLKQDEQMPAISFSRFSGARDYTHDGPSGLENLNFEVTCWDTTGRGAKLVANTVRDALSGFKGLVGADQIDGMFIRNESHDRENDPRDLARVALDMEVWYSEL